MELLVFIGMVIAFARPFWNKGEKFRAGYHGIQSEDDTEQSPNTKHRRVRIKDGVDYSLGHFDGKSEELEVEVLESGEVVARRVYK